MIQTMIDAILRNVLPPPKAQARWVGSTLTVAFHTSNPPIVWQTSLDHGRVLNVLLESETDQWVIMVRTGEGKSQPIATFRTREDAWDSFHIFQRALFARPRSKRGHWEWLPAFLAGALVVWITMVAYMPLMRLSVRLGLIGLSSPSPATQTSSDQTAEKQESAEPKFPPGQPPSGVPVDADQALNPPTN